MLIGQNKPVDVFVEERVVYGVSRLLKQIIDLIDIRRFKSLCGDRQRLPVDIVTAPRCPDGFLHKSIWCFVEKQSDQKPFLWENRPKIGGQVSSLSMTNWANTFICRSGYMDNRYSAIVAPVNLDRKVF